MFFLKYQQAAKRNTKPNKPLPHPINNYLVLLEFHGITILETKIPLKIPSNFPVFQKNARLFSGSGSKKLWFFTKSPPLSGHSFSGKKLGGVTHDFFGARTRYERWCFWERFTCCSSLATLPDSASTAKERKETARSPGLPHVVRVKEANMAGKRTALLVLSVGSAYLLGWRNSKSETVFRDSLGEGNVVEIHNIKHNLAPVLLWWCQLTSKKWIQMMNISF